MKFFCCFASLLCFSVLSLAASPSAWAAPGLSFDGPVFDFGRIEQGKTVEHRFSFRNTGAAPVTIQRVGSSCGCTVATPSSRILNPGGNGEIKASFDSSDFSGPISKEIFVYTSDPRTPSHTLLMKGIVIEEIVVTPNQLNLGEVKAGVRKDGVLKVENKGDRTIRIKEVKSMLPQMAASCDRKLLRQGEAATIRVSLTPTGDRRFINGYINIVTDSRKKPEKEVPVFSVLRK